MSKNVFKEIFFFLIILVAVFFIARAIFPPQSSCPTGYVLGTDKICHQICGSDNVYCATGATCFDGQCITCSSGEVLGTDGQCHAVCGDTNNYCASGSYCYNNQCLTCPSGEYLGTDGQCYPNTPPEQQNNYYSLNTPNAQENTQATNSQSVIIQQNQPPYYSAFCNEINPYNLNVREAASNAIPESDAGTYSITQILDIYDWVKSNIKYLNVPITLSEVPYPPEQTLATQSGDCKNQAVLLASMINSIGGTARVVANPQCNHAYVLVYFTNDTTQFNNLLSNIQSRYSNAENVMYYMINGGYWVVFDTAGGNYPGDLLPACQNTTEFDLISSCVSPST